MIKRFIKRMIGFNNPSDYGALTTEEVEEIGRIMSEGFSKGIQKGMNELNIKFKVLNKPAEAGDFIRVTNAWSTDEFYKNGDILSVASDDLKIYGGAKGVYVIKPRTKTHPKSERFILDAEYEVVAQVDSPKSPKYTIVDRPAKAGDFIHIVAAENTLGKYEDGDILVVDGTTNPIYLGVYVDDVGVPGSINPNGFIANSEYILIEGPSLHKGEEVESDGVLPTLDPSEILFDNLIRRIEDLEELADKNDDKIYELDMRMMREIKYGRGRL